MPTCSLLAIGNELLNGEIRDLNLYTLSQSLTHLGFCVNQAVVVRDSPASIGSGLSYLLASKPDVVFCSGGLGPTGDDLTLQSLAQYLGRDLVLHAEAHRMVEAQYDRLIEAGFLEQRGPQAAREKMARLPEGARPLPNPVGTAPAVCVEVQDTTLYVLPGVPVELDAIFTASVVPELRQRFSLGFWAHAALRVFVDDEADVAGPLKQATTLHPDVYLKSLAQPFPAASQEGLRVIASVNAASDILARKTVHAALADLGLALQAAGLRYTHEEDPQSS